MKRGGASAGSLIAAIAMALLVGSVFLVLQDYGPESALRKFHRSVLSRDFGGLRRFVTPSSHDESINTLAMMVDGYARAGARYQMHFVQRENRRVVAEVAYIMPGRSLVLPVIWVVEKTGGRWRVNADQTLAIRRQMYGM